MSQKERLLALFGVRGKILRAHIEHRLTDVIKMKIQNQTEIRKFFFTAAPAATGSLKV
jgi:hypothetical protein